MHDLNHTVLLIDIKWRGYLFCFICFFTVHSGAQQLIIHSSIHTAGIEVNLPTAYDIDHTSHCFVEYKEATKPDWKSGIEADRISISGRDQYKESLFNLLPATTYHVRVRLVDSFPQTENIELPIQSLTTREIFEVHPTNHIKWVSPNGAGTEYSQQTPGRLNTLLGQPITCGTTVMLMDGLYQDKELAITLTGDCPAEEPVVFMAAPGANPVFDGGYYQPLQWTQSQSNPNLYSAALPEAASYTNLCLLNGKMLYPYPSVIPNILVDTFSLTGLGFQYDGFVRDDKTIYIHTRDGTDPNESEVILSQAFRFMTIYGNGSKAHLVFDGITVKHFAKPNIPLFSLGYAAMAFDLRNVNEIVFSHCHFSYNNFHLSFGGTCDDILIQSCTFQDETGLWSHGMIKKSVSDQSVLVPSSVCRQYENGAVFLEDGHHLTVRENFFDGTCSGIVKQFETGIIDEADIYDNIFINNFDAIECDGQWTNLRVWNNEIKSAMAAFSLAPPLTGPRYFYRNRIHHIAGRQNIQNDPYYTGCMPPESYTSAGVGIKTNSGVPPDEQAGAVYFINNTFHSDDTLGFTYTLWDGEWKKATFINNIFYALQNKISYFQGFKDKTHFQLRSVNDNYYAANQYPIATIKEIHGQYTCHEVDDILGLQSELTTITGSDNIQIQNPFQSDPLFADAGSGNFMLTPGSPMIDRGIIVKGFYDFNGASPDLGAIESDYVSAGEIVQHQDRILLYPNPTDQKVIIDLKEISTQIDVSMFNVFGQLVSSAFYRDTDHLEMPIDAPSGTYFLVVEDAMHQRTVFKIIKW